MIVTRNNRKPGKGQRTLGGMIPRRFESFLEFHRKNPAVWAWFKFFARQMRSRTSKGGARLIGERIRWEVAVPVDRSGSPPPLESDIKFNDHHWPYYARLLMQTEPGFQDFFTIKNKHFDIDADQLVREVQKIEQEAG